MFDTIGYYHSISKCSQTIFRYCNSKVFWVDNTYIHVPCANIEQYWAIFYNIRQYWTKLRNIRQYGSIWINILMFLARFSKILQIWSILMTDHQTDRQTWPSYSTSFHLLKFVWHLQKKFHNQIHSLDCDIY